MGWRFWIDEELLQRGAGQVGPDALLIYLYLRAGVRRRARDEHERALLAAGWRFAVTTAPEIATALYMSVPTVLRRVRTLVDRGWIRVERQAAHRVVYVLGRGDEWLVPALPPDSRPIPEIGLTDPRDRADRSQGLVRPIPEIGLTDPRDRSEIEKNNEIQEVADFPPLKRGSNEEEARKKRGESTGRPVRKIRRVEPEKSISPPAVPVTDPEPEKSISRLSPQEQRDERSALAKQEAGRNDDLTLDEIVAAWRYVYRERFGVDDPELRRKQDRVRAAGAFRTFVRSVGEPEWNRVRGYLFDRFAGWAKDFEVQKARTPPGWFRILALPDGRPPASWAAYAIGVEDVGRMNEPNTPPDEKLMLMPDGDQQRAVDLTWGAILDLAQQAKMHPAMLMKRLIAGLPHPHGNHIPPALMELLTDRDREAIRLADEARARKAAKRLARRG